MSGRCYQITLPDGTRAIVRTGKRNWRPSEADLKAIADCRRELERYEREHQVDARDCNHEDDGEGTCLGCGVQL